MIFLSVKSIKNFQLYKDRKAKGTYIYSKIGTVGYMEYIRYVVKTLTHYKKVLQESTINLVELGAARL